jgi:tRNA U34 2-thiouridine synthase MnmA/TrmU
LMDKTSAKEEDGNYWFAYGRYISIQWNENSTLIVSSDNEATVQQPFLE